MQGGKPTEIREEYSGEWLLIVIPNCLNASLVYFLLTPISSPAASATRSLRFVAHANKIDKVR